MFLAQGRNENPAQRGSERFASLREKSSSHKTLFVQSHASVSKGGRFGRPYTES
jgi:hypothetical protein